MALMAPHAGSFFCRTWNTDVKDVMDFHRFSLLN